MNTLPYITHREKKDERRKKTKEPRRVAVGCGSHGWGERGEAERGKTRGNKGAGQERSGVSDARKRAAARCERRREERAAE